MGEYEKALEDLDLALKFDPSYAKALIKKGDIKLDQKLYQESINEYTKCKEVAPQTPGLREKIKAA